jgi:hypothetical protein
MFESRHERLLPRSKFYLRLLRSAGTAIGIILCSLAIGILGYHHFEHLSWIDSLLNASMILSAMGSVSGKRVPEFNHSLSSLFGAPWTLIGQNLFLSLERGGYWRRR